MKKSSPQEVYIVDVEIIDSDGAHESSVLFETREGAEAFAKMIEAKGDEDDDFVTVMSRIYQMKEPL